jgi:hypothetical protein
MPSSIEMKSVDVCSGYWQTGFLQQELGKWASNLWKSNFPIPWSKIISPFLESSLQAKTYPNYTKHKNYAFNHSEDIRKRVW